MRVLINGIQLYGNKTGVGHYTAELIRCLGPLLGERNRGVCPPAWVESALRLLIRMRPAEGLNPTSWSTNVPGVVAALRGLRGWAYHLLRGTGKKAYRFYFSRTAWQGYDLYHEPNFLPLECDLPTVTSVHDLSVVLHPEWHPADRVAEHERHFQRGLTRTQHVITISESARQDAIRHLGISPDRISRTYMGVRPGLRPMDPAEIESGRHLHKLPPRYLLYLGTIEPRKNLMTLLRAYCLLPGSVREETPLILVGGWGWNSADVAAFLHDEARHRGVRYLGYLPDQATCLLYNAARALVFPSRYEGFGMPPIEMMACSGAVLASTANAIVETVGGKAHLTDPDDLNGWRDALHRVCTEDDWCRSLRNGTEEVARPFTWERCAIDTLSVYKRVLYGTEPAMRVA